MPFFFFAVVTVALQSALRKRLRSAVFFPVCFCAVYYSSKSDIISVVMTVLTILMLIALLALTPLRVSATFRFDFTDKSLNVSAALFWVKVFKEKFSLQGRYLVCSGSVDATLDVFTLDGESGANFAKALTVDSVNLTVAPDYTKTSPFAMVAVEAVCMTATEIACVCTNCRVRVQTGFSTANALFGEVVVSVSLAEILLVLTKQKIRMLKKDKAAD